MRRELPLARGDRALVLVVVLRVEGERAFVLLPAPESLEVPTIVGALEGWVSLEALVPYGGTVCTCCHPCPPTRRGSLRDRFWRLVYWLRALFVVCLALTCGCASYIHDAAQNATQSAIDTIDAPKYKGELDDMAAEAAGAARDKMLDADTSAKLVAIRDAMLDEQLHVEIAGLREELLGTRTRQLTLQLVDGSLANVDGYFAQWRETAFGQPLRDDLDALIVDAKPKLADLAGATIAPLKVTVDATAAKAERTAEWIGLGLLALLIVVEGWAHRRALERLAGTQGGARC